MLLSNKINGLKKPLEEIKEQAPDETYLSPVSMKDI